MPGDHSGLALDAARASGLVAEGQPLLVLLSGGADSVCLLDVALQLGARVSALHVNYGLRVEAEHDEAHCRELCAGLEIALEVERAWLPEEGNLQAHAREARYRMAERVAQGDYATAHTASDQAETVLYRLAVSPGRRALLGMEPRRGRLVRPLLHVTREDTRAWCRSRGLAWREDASNADPRFARSRVRHDLLPALRSLGGAPERTIAETALLLRDEAEVLEEAVGSMLAELGGGPAVQIAALRELSPGLARLVLRALAERAEGAQRALSRAEAEPSLRWETVAAPARWISAEGCAPWPSTARCASVAEATHPRRIPWRWECPAWCASGPGRSRPQGGPGARWPSRRAHWVAR